MKYTYITVSVEIKNARICKEQVTESKEFFINKIVDNWKELLYDHELYYFKCKSSNDKNKLILNHIKSYTYIDVKNKTNSKIINKQIKDIDFLFKNKMFDVLYVIPKIKLNESYYFDFLIFLNKYDLCKVNAIESETFELISIDKIFTLKNFEVDFDIVNSILDLDSKFKSNDYNLSKYNVEEEYNKYTKSLFSLLCTQIHSFEKLNYGLENAFDKVFSDTYDLNIKFPNSIKNHHHTYLIRSLIYENE